MARYTSGFKSRMVQRMAGPEAISINALSAEIGVSHGALSRWLQSAGTLGGMSKKHKNGSNKARRRTAEDKLRLVIEASGLSEAALGEFLRREGVHEAQLIEWREKVMVAGAEALKDAHRKKSEQTPEARENRELRRELHRKEKALAETAALLVLKKKLNTYYSGERDDGTDTRSET